MSGRIGSAMAAVDGVRLTAPKTGARTQSRGAHAISASQRAKGPDLDRGLDVRAAGAQRSRVCERSAVRGRPAALIDAVANWLTAPLARLREAGSRNVPAQLSALT